MTSEDTGSNCPIVVLFEERIDPATLMILMGTFFKNLVTPASLDLQDKIVKDYLSASQEMSKVFELCTSNTKHSANITLNHGNGKITEIQGKILEVYPTKVVIEQYHCVTFVMQRKNTIQLIYGPLRREIYFSTPTYYISEVKIFFTESKFNFFNDD